MILTEYQEARRTTSPMSLLHLEQEELWISSFSCKFTSASHSREPALLHTCSRSLVLQPLAAHLNLVLFPLSDSSLQVSFRMSGTVSPRKPQKKVNESLLILTASNYKFIQRKPPAAPTVSILQESFAFEMSQESLTQVQEEIELIKQADDEIELLDVLLTDRYEALLRADKDELEDEEMLLELHASRILLEGKQHGAFLLTQSSLHFFPLINASAAPSVHCKFRQLLTAMRYVSAHQNNAIIAYFSGRARPILIAFETEEQCENIYSYLQHRTKFRDPKNELQSMTGLWSEGKLTNFQYLLFLNHAASRSTEDIAQYPVFPWLLRNFTSESLDLEDARNYRDLAKPIGALNHHRLERLRSAATGSKGQEPLYSCVYSTPTTVAYYLLRVIPEFLTRNSNYVYAPTDRLFKGIQSSFESCLHKPGDYRELIPEFYSGNSEFLLNCSEAQLDSTLSDVELPAWAKSPEQFSEIMRFSLESDFVSSHLHSWIDLIFGDHQRGEKAFDADNTFTQTALGAEQGLKGLKQQAQSVLIREYGVVPVQLFTQPHPQRAFRRVKVLKPYVTAPRVVALQRQLEAVRTELWRVKKLSKKSKAKPERRSSPDKFRLSTDREYPGPKHRLEDSHKKRSASSSVLYS
mmetsp:Transcript_7742/g.14691  ORF Transcript_7742/g.14691 Transcript_7742/m.14691 type:complete len:636 (+) Transcript_7742:7299-9206(+)